MAADFGWIFVAWLIGCFFLGFSRDSDKDSCVRFVRVMKENEAQECCVGEDLWGLSLISVDIVDAK